MLVRERRQGREAILSLDWDENWSVPHTVLNCPCSKTSTLDACTPEHVSMFVIRSLETGVHSSTDRGVESFLDFTFFFFKRKETSQQHKAVSCAVWPTVDGTEHYWLLTRRSQAISALCAPYTLTYDTGVVWHVNQGWSRWISATHLILASMKTSRVEPMGAEKAEVSRSLLTFFTPRVTSACALSLCAGSQNVHIFMSMLLWFS